MARHAALLLTLVLAFAACQGGEDTTGQATLAQQAPQGTAAGQRAPADGVTVLGHGRVPGEPDTLRATVGVEVTRDDVDQAFEEATAAADQVLAAVREHGVADEDIRTREFTVRPEREPRPDQPPALAGYTVRNLVEVTIRDVGQAGSLLSAVADAAGDDARVEGLRFALEEDDALLRAARDEAFADARAKAEHYAELAGRHLGPLLSLTEATAQLPPPIPMPADEVAVDRAGPPIEPGEQEVGVRIQATWALE